jgi:hypothetical protein
VNLKSKSSIKVKRVVSDNSIDFLFSGGEEQPAATVGEISIGQEECQHLLSVRRANGSESNANEQCNDSFLNTHGSYYEDSELSVAGESFPRDVEMAFFLFTP